jgi:hypothetical protein
MTDLLEKIVIEAKVYADSVRAETISLLDRNAIMAAAKTALAEKRSPETEFDMMKAHTIFDQSREQVSVLCEKLVVNETFVNSLKPADKADLYYIAGMSEFYQEGRPTAAAIKYLKKAMDLYSAAKPPDAQKLLTVHMAILRCALATEVVQEKIKKGEKIEVDKESLSTTTSLDAYKKCFPLCTTSVEQARLLFCAGIAERKWVSEEVNNIQRTEEFAQEIKIMTARHKKGVEELESSKRPKEMMNEFFWMNVILIVLAAIGYLVYLGLRAAAPAKKLKGEM